MVSPKTAYFSVNTLLILCMAAASVWMTIDSGTLGGMAAAGAQSRSDDRAASKIVGRAGPGRDVFRFETFGNEGFWTGAARMPKGMMDAKVTPMQALQAGLLVDIDLVPKAMRDAMTMELKTDLSPQNAPMLNDPMTTVKLIEANAVIGIVSKDSNGDGRIDIASGDKLGVRASSRVR